MKGCFFCHGRAPEGGSTVVVVALQCAAAGRDGHSFAIDLVCANVGDSGALMLPHPSELEGMTPEDREQHVRLNREHNPDDPFEARRLVDAGARLGVSPGSRARVSGHAPGRTLAGTSPVPSPRRTGTSRGPPRRSPR